MQCSVAYVLLVYYIVCSRPISFYFTFEDHFSERQQYSAVEASRLRKQVVVRSEPGRARFVCGRELFVDL